MPDDQMIEEDCPDTAHFRHTWYVGSRLALAHDGTLAEHHDEPCILCALRECAIAIAVDQCRQLRTQTVPWTKRSVHVEAEDEDAG